MVPFAAAQAPAYRIIVHPDNPMRSIDRKFLAQAFLKKISQWPGNDAIRPVDLRRDSEVRRRFTEEMLDRSVAAVRSYWQQLIFSGRGVPPPEMESDEEVVRFVLRHPGGIGYVSTGAALGGAKELGVK